ncbi:hypothetical protein C1882_04790 [Pseudomonas sp. FW305-E2]|nr:hypothetical protein C1882_04790 [Pseudomonas sp. FW305-E2]
MCRTSSRIRQSNRFWLPVPASSRVNPLLQAYATRRSGFTREWAAKRPRHSQGWALTLRTTRPMLNPCTRIDDNTTM